jgi:NAD(P)-dependent dehydrogenase (short-subunit alcohol dehydrogenase family)
MDLADLSSVQACVREMSATNFKASVVINNAGLTSPYDEVTAQGYELTAGVNFIGTAYFTLSLLKAGVLADDGGTAGNAGRVVMVSSEEHRADNIEPLQMRYPTAESFCKPNANADGGMHNAMRRYATSKLLLTTFSHELARRQQGVEVLDVCPGPVASDIARAAPWPVNHIVAWGMRQTFQTPERAALPVVKLALQGAAAFRDHSKTSDPAGAVHFHMSEPRPAVVEATDIANGEWIWSMTSSVVENWV